VVGRGLRRWAGSPLPGRHERPDDLRRWPVLLDTIKGADLGGVDGRPVLDFHFGHHPSCTHDPRWTCPLAPPENRLDAAVEAGELMPPW
jgi:hypothetical protein